MKLDKEIIDAVRRVANVVLISGKDAKRWNKHRKDGELLMYGGWAWISKDNRRNGQNFRCPMAAYKDAYTKLVLKLESAPSPIRKPRLVVHNRKAA